MVSILRLIYFLVVLDDPIARASLSCMLLKKGIAAFKDKCIWSKEFHLWEDLRTSHAIYNTDTVEKNKSEWVYIGEKKNIFLVIFVIRKEERKERRSWKRDSGREKRERGRRKIACIPRYTTSSSSFQSNSF